MKTFFPGPPRLSNNANARLQAWTSMPHTSGYLHHSRYRTGSSFFSSIGLPSNVNRQSQTASTSFPPPLALTPQKTAVYIHRRAYWLQVSRKRAKPRQNTNNLPRTSRKNTTATFFALIDTWQPHTHARTSLTRTAVGARIEPLNSPREGEVVVQLRGRYKFHSILETKKRNRQTRQSARLSLHQPHCKWMPSASLDGGLPHVCALSIGFVQKANNGRTHSKITLPHTLGDGEGLFFFCRKL